MKFTQTIKIKIYDELYNMDKEIDPFDSYNLLLLNQIKPDDIKIINGRNVYKWGSFQGEHFHQYIETRYVIDDKSIAKNSIKLFNPISSTVSWTLNFDHYNGNQDNVKKDPTKIAPKKQNPK